MCGISHTMIESLKKIGLNNTEADIYLQLIKKGEMTAVEISKETKIHRRTIYDNLSILMNKGLASHHISNGVKYFKANSPKVLREIQEEKLSVINKILPSLESYFSNHKKNPNVDVLKGLDATKTLFYDMKAYKGEIYWLGGGFQILNTLTPNKKNLLKEMSKLNLKIIQPKPKRNLFKEYFLKSEIRFIDEKYSSKIAFFVYQDTVITGSLVNDEYFVIKVEDKEIAKAYKNIFEVIWNK